MSPADSPLAPGRASISYAAAPKHGLATLSEALRTLESDGHLDRLEVIVLYGGEVAPDFQQEVIDKLKEYAPREFAIAIGSGGGTYDNPELRPLHRVFDELVLETATVSVINDHLAALGKRISGASHEKLMFRTVAGRLTVHFFLYLEVEDS